MKTKTGGSWYSLNLCNSKASVKLSEKSVFPFDVTDVWRRPLCICVCKYTHIYIYIYIYKLCLYMHIIYAYCLCVYVYLCICVYVSMCMYGYVYMYLYLCMCLRVCIYIYIYIYIYIKKYIVACAVLVSRSPLSVYFVFLGLSCFVFMSGDQLQPPYALYHFIACGINPCH